MAGCTIPPRSQQRWFFSLFPRSQAALMPASAFKWLIPARMERTLICRRTFLVSM